eukprot:GHVS01060635.1.p1 GENE.GHVS01060635.1~~GHVS01060635.1.p1  ORF type:complete len:210 (-),score=17.83 GHVS01060635.1:130-729(-)
MKSSSKVACRVGVAIFFAAIIVVPSEALSHAIATTPDTSYLPLSVGTSPRTTDSADIVAFSSRRLGPGKSSDGDNTTPVFTITTPGAYALSTQDEKQSTTAAETVPHGSYIGSSVEMDIEAASVRMVVCCRLLGVAVVFFIMTGLRYRCDGIGVIFLLVAFLTLCWGVLLGRIHPAPRLAATNMEKGEKTTRTVAPDLP